MKNDFISRSHQIVLDNFFLVIKLLELTYANLNFVNNIRDELKLGKGFKVAKSSNYIVVNKFLIFRVIIIFELKTLIARR